MTQKVFFFSKHFKQTAVGDRHKQTPWVKKNDTRDTKHQKLTSFRNILSIFLKILQKKTNCAHLKSTEKEVEQLQLPEKH